MVRVFTNVQGESGSILGRVPPKTQKIVRVFTNIQGESGSILGRVLPKTQKMILDASLLNTHHYKVWIKGKWTNPRKGIVPYPTVVDIEKGVFRLPLTMVTSLLIIVYKLFVLDSNSWDHTTVC